MMREPPSEESEARRVVRLAQVATARLRALRRVRESLARRSSCADVERCFTECSGARREVQLRGLTGRSAQMILNELLRRASPTACHERVWQIRRNDPIALGDLPNAALLAVEGRVNLDIVLTGITQAGIALPDLGVRVSPSALQINCDPGTAWTTDVVTAFLGLVADVSALVDCPATLELADERSDPLPERDQERFRAALSNGVP